MRRWLQLVEKLESRLTHWQQADRSRSQEPPSERQLMGWAALILLGVPAMAFGIVWAMRLGALGLSLFQLISVLLQVLVFLYIGFPRLEELTHRPPILLKPTTRLYLIGLPVLGMIALGGIAALFQGFPILVALYGFLTMPFGALIVGKRALLQQRSEAQLERE